MSVYLINSPYQLFNALNYADQCDIDQKKILLLICRNSANHVQVKNILKNHNVFTEKWDVSSFLLSKGLLSKLLLFSVLLLVKAMLFFSTINQTVIIGDANYNKIVLLIRGLFVKRLVLLDDGMLTLHYSYGSLSKRFRIQMSRINLFTSLDISNLPVKIIRNNLQYFSKRLQRNTNQPVVYFVGQPLIELNILKYNDYIYLISLIRTKYAANKKMVYLAHRGETDENINKIQQEFINFDFKATRFDQTIEFEILDGLPLPELWFSCYSSALSLVSGYDKGSEIIAVDIRKMVEPSFSKQLDIVYEELRNSSVKIIEI